VTERQRALELLRRIERESLYASIALIGESGFVRTIVLGVLRWRSRLDHAIETFAERKIKKLDPLVVDVLRVGIYQLHFMDVAAYAAVSESVDTAPKRARGFVNAILRRATKGLPEPPDVATKFAHPRWLFDRWSRMYGEERAIAIMEANQELSYPDVLAFAGAPAGATPSSLVPDIYKLQGSSADLDRADFYPMDEGSAVIAFIASNLGKNVLDLAAAPGGKTLYMRHRGVNVTSSDVSISRLLPLKGRQRRLLVADGRQPPFHARFPVVLLDAPCSATGTIRKNPEIKWRLREEDLAAFATLQRELLESAFSIAAEAVVYSTCSLEREENDSVVQGFDREDIAPYVPQAARRWVEDGVLRLTPESGADGFTAFVLRRSR
jgi:16S rRNA (cytosine967-C5)-methyltransferase